MYTRCVLCFMFAVAPRPPLCAVNHPDPVHRVGGGNRYQTTACAPCMYCSWSLVKRMVLICLVLTGIRLQRFHHAYTIPVRTYMAKCIANYLASALASASSLARRSMPCSQTHHPLTVRSTTHAESLYYRAVYIYHRKTARGAGGGGWYRFGVVASLAPRRVVGRHLQHNHMHEPPWIPLQNWPFTPELQRQSRGKRRI